MVQGAGDAGAALLVGDLYQDELQRRLGDGEVRVPGRRLTLYCFLEVSADDWAPALASWLGVRRRLRDDVGIPVRRELHAVDFLSGRGNPSLEASWNRSKAERLRTGLRLVEAVAGMPISWSIVHGDGGQRSAVYGAGLNDLDRRLSRSLDHGLVMVDGDGTDPAYLDAHRELDLRSRRVVEDPWHQGSHSNQWIMIADFVAYLAFQDLRRNKPALQGWYAQYLSAQDMHGGPRRVS